MTERQSNSPSRAATAPSAIPSDSSLTMPPVLGLELDEWEQMALALCTVDAAHALRAAANGDAVQCGRSLAHLERTAHAMPFWPNAYCLSQAIERFAMSRFKPRQSGGSL